MVEACANANGASSNTNAELTLSTMPPPRIPSAADDLVTFIEEDGHRWQETQASSPGQHLPYVARQVSAHNQVTWMTLEQEESRA